MFYLLDINNLIDYVSSKKKDLKILRKIKSKIMPKII
jgi:hypothetical protein